MLKDDLAKLLKLKGAADQRVAKPKFLQVQNLGPSAHHAGPALKTI